MKQLGSIVSALVIVRSFAGSTLAADGVTLKEKAGDNYCHAKFPAIIGRTLAEDHPVLKSSAAGDVIDFYGSCDETPTSKDEVAAQRLDEQHRLDQD